MRGRTARTIASASASVTSSTRRPGSTPARKQPSDFQMLPMPPPLRWASSAAPVWPAWRLWGVSIETISLPTSADPIRLAALWIVSPSGIRLRGEGQLARPLPEAHVDQHLLDLGADDRLAVEALDREALQASAPHVV